MRAVYRQNSIVSPDSISAMQRLVDVVQELSLARDLTAIMEIVREAARDLTGADGATFVLRDGTQCFYADENAISPLWKGQRFPMSACISGWAMLHKQSVAITDIFADPRIPTDAYRPTFVKSLAMVPIRTADPIGAIGNYWASSHTPTEHELDLLQKLANTTAVAIENVQLYTELERRVTQRTQELQAANRELEAFSYAVSHDLRAPLRNLRGLLEVLAGEHASQLHGAAAQCVAQAQTQTRRMNKLIGDLLWLSQASRAELRLERVNLSQLVDETLRRLRAESPHRTAQIRIEEGLHVTADRGLLRVALENLLGNAWKYSADRPVTAIEFGAAGSEGPGAYYLKDNGIGFRMEDAAKIFEPFQRLHGAVAFAGSGVGLATVRRIIERHGGTIWAEAAEGQGSTFYFTLNTAKDWTRST